MSEKLTKEQKNIVREIVKQAKELGIDPEFAVSLANLESSFSHVPASDKESTAFGPFQVNKATAAANGVDYEEMKKSPELAVKTGLVNLIRHAKNPDLMSVNPDTGEKEVDTARIIAAHRMGENSDFARTGDPKTIDPTLRGYLKDVAQHFPDQTFPMAVYTPPIDTKADTAEAGTPPAADVESQEPKKAEAKSEDGLSLENLPLPLQSPLMGAAGAAAGASLGMTKYPVVAAYNYMTNDPNSPDHVTKVAADNSRSDKQMMATGDRSNMSGRERQEGYNIETAQRAAVKQQQDQVAKAHGLNPNAVLANSAGLASTPAGIIAPKEAVNDFQKRANMAVEMSQSTNPTIRDRGRMLVQTLKSVGANTSNSFPGKTAKVGFGVGAAAPYAVEAARADHPVAGLGLMGAAGYLANKFPKAFGKATTAGALLGAGYAAAHPAETAKQMRMSDVVDPTVAMYMTGPEMYEPAIPELQEERRRAGAGRGFINPPLGGQ